MTTIEHEHPQRERIQQPQEDQRAAQAERDRARREGNRIDLLADVAEQSHEMVEDERDDRTRYEDAFQVLRWLIGAEWAERTVDQDVVLHDKGGSLDPEKVTEFISLILSGHSSHQARKAMLRRQRYEAHAEKTRRAVAAAREVSRGLHQFADGLPLVPSQRQAAPALPAGSSAPSNGVPLPQRREPIAPPPPEVPHVDEPREWSTMQAGQIALAGEARGVLKPETVQRLSDEGYGKQQKPGMPDMGPAAPTQFAATSIPAQRDMRDTQPMRLDEVLGHLAMDDAGVEAAGEPDSVVRPFSGTGLSGDASPARDSGAGDDDAS